MFNKNTDFVVMVILLNITKNSYCLVIFEPYRVFQLQQLQQFQAGNATGRPHGQSVTFTLPPHSTAAPVSTIEPYREAKWCNALHLFCQVFFSFCYGIFRS
jgi:hypothetical protein